MKRFFIFSLFLVSGFWFLVTDILHAEEIVLYDFEKDPQGWNIPDWALAKKDYVAEEIGISEFYASRNRYSLEMQINFPVVKEWRGAYAECPVDIQDWSEYGWLEADILLPKESPKGLRAKLILTVGDDWKWTEINKALRLEPGEWTVIKVDIRGGSANLRSFITDDFRRDVKKIGIRIESNGGIAYKGPVYIDNIKLSRD